jgi:hypothetical protein
MAQPPAEVHSGEFLPGKLGYEEWLRTTHVPEMVKPFDIKRAGFSRARSTERRYLGVILSTSLRPSCSV